MCVDEPKNMYPFTGELSLVDWRLSSHARGCQTDQTEIISRPGTAESARPGHYDNVISETEMRHQTRRSPDKINKRLKFGKYISENELFWCYYHHNFWRHLREGLKKRNKR